MERETTGLYLTGHPMDDYRALAQQAKAAPMGDILASFHAPATAAHRYRDGQRVVLAVGDGLSSAAVQANAPDCCAAIRQGLQAQGIELGPVPFIQFCRVGAGDHIGDLTDCEVICLLVGERPGLVTNESMSAYLTYRPHTGIAESCRTVVSNIHRQGVSAVEAGAHIASLLGRILAQKASGIGLREDGA